MRRSRLVVTILSFVLVVAAGVVLYLKLRKPLPTKFNWKAQVLSIAGNGSPLFNDAPQPTQAGFSDPFGVVVGSDGTLYVSDAGDSNRIRKLTREGALLTVAGEKEGFADGIHASFNTPSGLALDDQGNLYVADTGNNRIRKVTTEGVVSTLAGNGSAGYADGPASSAEFNGPIGLAVDSQNSIYVADTYNDRIRKITADGFVTTVAGSEGLGYRDGPASSSQFDTPCGIVIKADGTLIVADTGNGRLRQISPSGDVTTLGVIFNADPNRNWLRSPIGLALTHDGFLYVTEHDRGTIIQIDPDGRAVVLAGNQQGYSEGFGPDARFNHPSGIAIDNRGDLVVADSANYLLRRINHSDGLPPLNATDQPLPRLTKDTLGIKELLWPLDPQDRPHEVAATMGEVRGSFDSTDARDHLHSGLDVAGAYGETVRVTRWERVSSPLPNWGFDTLSEGIRVAIISYIHINVGRDKDGNVFNDPRFMAVKNEAGKVFRIRVRRGSNFKPGDAIGTVNKMYHVHLIVGPSGGEINPLDLSPIGFKDTVAPMIEKDGIQLYNESGERLEEIDRGRLIVRGKVHIVVDAFDLTDLNNSRRRLGLYSLGYQVLKGDTTPAPGFAAPRVNIVFNRLPADDNAAKLAYASDSGITVYGSKTTRFLYELTNTVRDGHARAGVWDTSELEKGDYVLRIVAADFTGNQTQRDVLVSVKQ
ncbi:MAG TPA: NHL repeat-containing protein [Pyrinomonadaceae bacterium]